MQKAIETNNATKGMDLQNGKRHYDSNGNPLGGIKAKVINSDNQQIEVEMGEVVITRGAVSNPKKYKIEGTTKEILSTLNQEGGGVPINETEAEIVSKYKRGGSISRMTSSELKEFYTSDEGKKLDAETYAEWNKLVNMTKSELEKFYNSVEGKEAGLTTSQAKEKGIDSGRESARWILKMKDIPYKEWTSNMWRWAKKQINFIKRMSGMKGSLYNDKGEKTRKHTALLIWGHNPELTKGLKRFKGGGELSKKALAVETNDLTDFVRKYFIKDGRIDVSDAMQELFGNKRGKSIADEYRKRIGLHKKGGLTISQLAHNLWEQHRDEVREDIDDSDFRNAVEEVLISEYGVSSMIKSLMEKSGESEQDRENEYWMNQFDEGNDEYYEDLSDEEVADYFKDMEGFERELAKGTEHEMEHLETLKKVAEGKLTPEEAVVETASKHLEENPQYYEDLAKMEKENQVSNLDNLISIMSSKVKNQGYSLKELYDEVIKFQGSRDGALIFSEFIKRKKDEGDTKIMDEFNRTSFVENINPVKEQEESIPDLIEGLKVLAESLEGAEKKEIEDVIEGLEILLESDDKFAEGGEILWATKIGEPDYNEQLITENPSQIENAKKWAMENGFDRIRVSTIDNSKPDFTKGFKKYAEGGELDNNSMFFEMNKADQDEEKRIMENQFGKNI